MIRHEAYAQGFGNIAMEATLGRHVGRHRELRRDFRRSVSVLCHCPHPCLRHDVPPPLHRLYLNSVVRLLIKYNCVTKKSKKQPARVKLRLFRVVATPLTLAGRVNLEDGSNRHRGPLTGIAHHFRLAGAILFCLL
jgi:hypothetical protein